VGANESWIGELICQHHESLFLTFEFKRFKLIQSS
jgi:hypothetical protein